MGRYGFAYISLDSSARVRHINDSLSLLAWNCKAHHARGMPNIVCTSCALLLCVEGGRWYSYAAVNSYCVCLLLCSSDECPDSLHGARCQHVRRACLDHHRQSFLECAHLVASQ